MLLVIKAIATAFAMGFLAAAPTGPVNTVAIHRGLVGRWTHALACGVGATLVDIGVFRLVLLGRRTFISVLESPQVKHILMAVAAVVLAAIGLLFLWKAFRMDLRRLVASQRKMARRPPRHLWSDVGTGVLLTAMNPGVVLYWTSVTMPWLTQFPAEMHHRAIFWGVPSAAAGMLTWFAVLSALIRFKPRRLGVNFFRTVYIACGLALLAFAGYAAVDLLITLI